MEAKDNSNNDNGNSGVILVQIWRHLCEEQPPQQSITKCYNEGSQQKD